MKRFLALILFLALCLTLAGCGAGTNVTPPPEPTPAPPKATPTAQEPPELPKATLTPRRPLAERLAGAYRLNREAPGEDGEEEQICVEIIGGVVLIESIALHEGSVYSFWAQEIWPEDAAALQSPSADAVTGVNLMFSTMSNDGNYWDAATDITVTVTEDGLSFTETLDDLRTQRSYERIEDEGQFHTLPPLDLFPKRPAAEPSPVGDWCFAAGESAARLSLRDDGSLRYAAKSKGTPLCAYTGVWGVGEDGALQVIAVRLGGGDMPYEWQLDCSMEDDALVLTDLYEEQPMLPAAGALRFSPAAADWVFPAALYDAA